jgi:hypothetical protein
MRVIVGRRVASTTTATQTKIMTEMGDVDIPASIAYFQENGGYRDCEIGFNVDPEVSKH